jgi:8-hydroxy-5-deazaflavin:NADPH oxidoreductase
MKIAVIGAGNVGTSLARAAVAAGHTVTLSAGTPEKAAAVAGTVGAVAATSNGDAVPGADLVVLAVPHSAVAAVAAEIRDVAAGIPVVDATNPLNATYSDLVIDGTSAAGDLQALLPASPVVKAFNTVFASRYAAPTEDGRALPVLVAGDDADAKATVGELVNSLGFQTLDVGGLRQARGLEELAFLNIGLNAANGWVWQSAWDLVGPTSLA